MEVSLRGQVLLIYSSRWWKMQFAIAKDTCRLDVLCYRIYLSCRILSKTLRFEVLHQIVTDIKAKPETEVGPIDRISTKMARAIVSRLPVARDVQQLCSLWIKKAGELLVNSTDPVRGSKPVFHWNHSDLSHLHMVHLKISRATSSGTTRAEKRHINKSLTLSSQEIEEGFLYPIFSPARSTCCFSA